MNLSLRLPLRHAALLLALLVLALPAAADDAVEPLDRFPQADVTVVSGKHSHDFRVWVADTMPRQFQGLMYVRQLGPRQGMLFLYAPAQYVAFWMKNTFIPLDMLFIAPDGRIVNIVQRARPLSTEPLPSAEPVRGVLELPGGTVERLGIRPGDRVIHPAFSPLRTG